MIFTETSIKDAYFFTPSIIEDNRGFFFRAFCRDEMKTKGINVGEIVQINRSFNKSKGTFRGFHFQHPPFAEEKIITCVRGEVLDIVLDLRKGSPTFLKTDSVVLSEENKRSILIPKGCAHGFLTLKENCELTYWHTEYYKPDYEGGISVKDPMITISLPIGIEEMSDRDKSHKVLTTHFTGIEL